MADDNMEGDMEVETTNATRSAYSNEINVVINGKIKQNMHIFLSTVKFIKKKKPENSNLVP